jgi:hypothetical protein
MPITHRRPSATLSAIVSLALLGAAFVAASPASAEDHEPECFEDVTQIEWHELITPGSGGVKEYLWRHFNFESNGNEEWLEEGEEPNGSHNWSIVDERWKTEPSDPEYGDPEWYDEDDPPVGPAWEHTEDPATTQTIQVPVDCQDPCEADPEAAECQDPDPCEADPEAAECQDPDPCEADPEAAECQVEEPEECEGAQCEASSTEVVRSSTSTPPTDADRGDDSEILGADADPLISSATTDNAAVAGVSDDAPNTLPRTGLTTLPMLLMGLGFLSGGFSMVQFARRED